MTGFGVEHTFGGGAINDRLTYKATIGRGKGVCKIGEKASASNLLNFFRLFSHPDEGIIEDIQSGLSFRMFLDDDMETCGRWRIEIDN